MAIILGNNAVRTAPNTQTTEPQLTLVQGQVVHADKDSARRSIAVAVSPDSPISITATQFPNFADSKHSAYLDAREQYPALAGCFGRSPGKIRLPSLTDAAKDLIA